MTDSEWRDYVYRLSYEYQEHKISRFEVEMLDGKKIGRDFTSFGEQAARWCLLDDLRKRKINLSELRKVG